MKKRKISALLICLILALNACTGSGPSSATVSSTGATSAETETAAQIPEQNKKPELVIMGEEAQDYSRAVQAKKKKRQSRPMSGAERSMRQKTDRKLWLKISRSWSTSSAPILRAVTALPQTT